MRSVIWKGWLFLFFVLISWSAQSQFYRGSNQQFGKNRIQHDEFIWSYYKFDKFNVYFYGSGKETAVYTASTVQGTLSELEKLFDYSLDDEKIQFLIYNKIEHFRQSNIGYDDANDANIGGVTRIAGSKVFLYFDGDHASLEKQIRAGVAQIIISQMMFGENWKEMIKNSALLSLPDWYVNGLISYATEQWNVQIDDRMRDGVLTGRYSKFNRLTGPDAQYAGHSLWYYISETYGESVIPNILYMARVSRNVESGFLYVLGVSLKTLTEESLAYYLSRYAAEEQFTNHVEDGLLPIKTKRSRDYSQFKVGPEGRYVAYTSNELGQLRVYLYDLQKKRRKKLKKQFHKLERINETSYPLLDWHPAGDILAMVYEKKGKIILDLYDVKEKKTISKELFRMEKVLDFKYSPNGQKMIFSAMNQGQSDLYLYTIAANSQKKITNDIYDDLDPAFLDKGQKVIFSSNRTSDTLGISNDLPGGNLQSKDIFILDLNDRKGILHRVTNTPNLNESHPDAYSGEYFSFLSDESGIQNRYVGFMDSAISFIDTTTHYRYFSTAMPVTNYSRNILEQDVNIFGNQAAELMYRDGRYRLFLHEIPTKPQFLDTNLQQTGYRDRAALEEQMEVMKEVEKELERESTEEISYITVDVFQEEPEPEEPDSNAIDIDNYVFDSEKNPEKESPYKKNPETNSRFITLRSDSGKVRKPFQVPQKRNYNINFIAADVVTQFDFNFSNELYQRFNGGPYVSPGMGVVVKFGMLDLFEDYKLEGGFRPSFNGNSMDYFLSFENREKRLDKKYMFQRQTLTNATPFQISKTFIHSGQFIAKWPLSEVAAFRGTFGLRNDKEVVQSTDRSTLEEPNRNINWVSGKLEYIFDNTLAKGLNLYNGTRYKFFAEYYQEVNTSASDILIVGMDMRHYQKIHRDIIWANRVAASTSMGSRKLVYYLGSVDDWVVFSDRPRFDNDTEISNEENYYFQTIATPMRGFIQNVRNGNSFAVINSEIRFPVFKYFLNRPIKSDFVSNFQVIGFSDIGTAWTGRSPYSEDNSFNTIETVRGPVKITVQNQSEPIVASFGGGLRTKLWGYFVRFDYAWGVLDSEVQTPLAHFSLGLDF